MSSWTTECMGGKTSSIHTKKSKNICINYIIYNLFSLFFLPNWEDKKNVGPEKLFFISFSISLIFSPERNKRKFNFHLIFHFLFFSSLFLLQPNTPLWIFNFYPVTIIKGENPNKNIWAHGVQSTNRNTNNLWICQRGRGVSPNGPNPNSQQGKAECTICTLYMLFVPRM